MVLAAGAAPGAPAKHTGARLFRHVLSGRWFMFFAAILVMSTAGGTYIFGIYSTDLKKALHYNQRTLNTLSFFKDLGANIGIPSGLLNEVTPPWVVLAVGAGMNLAGYLMIYLAISGRTAPPAVWLMCLYITIGANSQSFANTGGLVTAVKNFPESRGIVLGLLKSFVGLSGAIFTQLYYAFYGGNNGKELVLLIAWLPAAVSLLFLPTIRIIPRVGKTPGGETRTLFRYMYASVALAVYLLVVIVVEQEVNFPRAVYYVAAVVVVFLMLFPIVIVVHQELRTLSASQAQQANQAAVVPKPAIQLSSSALVLSSSPDARKAQPTADTAWHQDIFKPPARGEDYTILQAFFSMDMMVLFFTTICGVGGCLTAIDNMGQIGQSLGYPSKSINTFVALVSIWNYAGRIASGFSSEYLLTRFKLPRPLVMTGVLLLAVVGHLLIAFGVSNGLYAASVIIGFTFGAQWPLLFAIISEIFGLKYYATLYNFGAAASPIGLYFLNVRLTGHVYDTEAEKQAVRAGIATAENSGGKDLTCIGTDCFKLSFLIITGVTLLGALVSLVLAWRTKEFYRSDLYARFREYADGEGDDHQQLGEEENGVINGGNPKPNTEKVRREE